MRLSRTTLLNANPDVIWEAVQRPVTLVRVAEPLVRFEPRRPAAFPARWVDGEYDVRLWLFGVLPMGRHRLRLSRRGEGPARLLRDDGAGQLAQRWDHLIRVEPTTDGRTRYADEVEVHAGLLTVPVWVLAQLFYWHRQRRWRALVRRGLRDLA